MPASNKPVNVDDLVYVKQYVDQKDATKYQTITYDAQTREVKFYKNGGTGNPDYTLTLPDVSNKLDKFNGSSSDAGKIVVVGSDGKVIAMSSSVLSDLATKEDLSDAITGIFVVAAELPQASSETMGAIYLVPNEGESPNVKDEYVTVRSGAEGSYTYTWELIGTTEVDLSGYVETSFEIAGINMEDDITASELKEALDVPEIDTSTNSISDGTNSIEGIWGSDDYVMATTQEVCTIFGITPPSN